MRGVSIVSSSANADRDEERNVNPAGWPSSVAASPTSASGPVGLGLSSQSLARQGRFVPKNTALGGSPDAPEPYADLPGSLCFCALW